MNPSRLTLGTAQLGTAYGIANSLGKPSGSAAHEILRLALEAGIRSFDTAPSYGDAEARLGAVFKACGFPDDVTVTMKLSGLASIGVPARDLSSWIRRSLEESLDRLGISRIHHFLLHSCTDLKIYGDSLVSALEEQVQAGTVVNIGASVYPPEDVALLLTYPFFNSIQFPLNLLDARIYSTGALANLKEKGFSTFARSPFLQGLLALNPADLPIGVAHSRHALQTLHSLLRPHGLTPMEAALPFVAAIPGVDSIVLGVESREQLLANIAAIDRQLPPTLVEEVIAAFVNLDDAVTDPRKWPVK